MAITSEPRAPETGDTAESDLPDVAGIVARVRATYDSGRTRPMAWRLEQLDGLVRMLTSEEERFTAALATDLGKPAIEGYLADVKSTINEIKDMRKHAPKWAKPRKVSLPMAAKPAKGWIRPEPLGVALVIAPWNYPIQLLLNPLAAALAAGNAVVAKPSELAPATSAALAELLPPLRRPGGGRGGGGRRVGVHRPAGRALRPHLLHRVHPGGPDRDGGGARHLTPVTLELGGKSPALVDDSADIEVTGRRLAWGKWLNAGQTCVAPDYVLATEATRDALVESMRAAFAEFSGGDTRGTADYARIVTQRHATRLQGLLADHGGTVAIGGEADPETRYVEPTVVVDPELDSGLMSEEIFGPILPVITVDSMDDAVDFVNDREKPLALYVFGEDDTVVESLVDRTTAGGTCVNHVILHLTPSTLPSAVWASRVWAATTASRVSTPSATCGP